MLQLKPIEEQMDKVLSKLATSGSWPSRASPRASGRTDACSSKPPVSTLALSSVPILPLLRCNSHHAMTLATHTATKCRQIMIICLCETCKPFIRHEPIPSMLSLTSWTERSPPHGMPRSRYKGHPIQWEGRVRTVITTLAFWKDEAIDLVKMREVLEELLLETGQLLRPQRS